MHETFVSWYLHKVTSFHQIFKMQEKCKGIILLNAILPDLPTFIGLPADRDPLIPALFHQSNYSLIKLKV